MTADTELPARIKGLPHWRIRIWPTRYTAELLPTLNSCFEAVQRSKVSLRGWDFPHVSRHSHEIAHGSSWVASWSTFGGHLEYWRFYQSGQFVHLAAVREAVQPGWKEKLQGEAKSHAYFRADVNWDAVPGYFSLLNFLYTVTEVFEFASRLASSDVFASTLQIEIGIHNVEGFALTPGWDRAWHDFRALSINSIERSWNVAPDALVSGSAELSLSATMWFFERFGWLEPAEAVLKRDQENFLRGLL